MILEKEIDGLLYSLDTDEQVATVKKCVDKKRTGEVVIPESFFHEGIVYRVTEIRMRSFVYCSSLTAIKISESVTIIGRNAFSRCSSLTTITIPEGVMSIGDGAFSVCSSLTTITIPEGVMSIGDYAFSGCSSLTAITIPKGVTSIGWGAFSGCSNLTSILIPKSVNKIVKEAFKSSGIAYLTILGKPTIDYEAFTRCEKLTDVYCYSEELPPTNNNAFGGLDLSRITLHVPESAIEAYKNTEPWSRFGTIVAIK